MNDVRNILVATDFSETSDRALDYAVDLAAKLGAAVTVVHAYEIPMIGFPDGAMVATADVAVRIQDAGRAGLDAAVAARKNRGVPIHGILRDGPAWEEICTLAEEQKADLIVVGTHGRHGLARALLGSVAEEVIRGTKVPVLAIHGPN